MKNFRLPCFSIVCLLRNHLLRLLWIVSISIMLGFAVNFSKHGGLIWANWLVLDLTPSELNAIPEPHLIIDARSSSLYTDGHIPGSIQFSGVNRDAGFLDFLDSWSPDLPVIVYCGGQACGLSKEIALRILSDLPDAKVFVLKGGYPAWQTYQAQKSSAAL